MTTIPQLHQTYVALSGLPIRLDMARERSWFEFEKRGFTEADLRLVILEIQKGIKAGKRHLGALRFRNLIESLDYFEEELAMVKARKRAPTVSAGRAQVLKGTGRSADPPVAKVRSAAEILASQNAIKVLRDFREANR
jgi:hypothetical protein